MGRKAIPNLDEKIIDETIRIGGVNQANVDFSTREIAKACGVSEFALFERFPTKTDLILACLRKVNQHYQEEIEASLAKEGLTLRIFCNDLFNFFVYHKSEALFVANYSMLSLKARHDNRIVELHHDLMKKNAHYVGRFLDPIDEENAYLIWVFLSRQILFQAQMVLVGLAEDTPEYRGLVIDNLISGAHIFFKDGNP
jgi:AcrR family transcriptional regulator